MDGENPWIHEWSAFKPSFSFFLVFIRSPRNVIPLLKYAYNHQIFQMEAYFSYHSWIEKFKFKYHKFSHYIKIAILSKLTSSTHFQPDPSNQLLNVYHSWDITCQHNFNVFHTIWNIQPCLHTFQIFTSQLKHVATFKPYLSALFLCSNLYIEMSLNFWNSKMTTFNGCQFPYQRKRDLNITSLHIFPHRPLLNLTSSTLLQLET